MTFGKLFSLSGLRSHTYYRRGFCSMFFKCPSRAGEGEGDTVANLPSQLELRGQLCNSLLIVCSQHTEDSSRGPALHPRKAAAEKSHTQSLWTPLTFLGELTWSSPLQFRQPSTEISVMISLLQSNQHVWWPSKYLMPTVLEMWC